MSFIDMNKYTFVSICPICGKTRRISWMKDGTTIECYKCGNRFLAINPRRRKKKK